MPKELNLTLNEKEVGELNDFLQELPAKYANPILNYLQTKINAQRKAEQEAEGKGTLQAGKEIEEVPIEEIEPFTSVMD